MLGEATVSIMAGMTETTVPHVVRGGERGEGARRRRTCERVELPRTIAPKDLAPGMKVLHRETKRVKNDDAMIISSELTNGNKVFDNARCY